MKKLSMVFAVSVSVLSLSGCSEPTQEELAASVKSDYLRNCERWGINFQISELGGERKYKDRSLLHYYLADDLKKANPWLDYDECKRRFNFGEAEGRRRVSSGQVEIVGGL